MGLFDTDNPQGLREIPWDDRDGAQKAIGDNFKATETHFKALGEQVKAGERTVGEVKEVARKAAADLAAIDGKLAELKARTRVEGNDRRDDGPEAMLRSFVADEGHGEHLSLTKRTVRHRGFEFEAPGLLDAPETYGDWHHNVKRLARGAKLISVMKAGKQPGQITLEDVKRHAPKTLGRLAYALECQAPASVRGPARATIERIFTNSSGTGAEFIPDEILVSEVVVDAKYDPSLQLVVDRIPQIPMDGNTLDHAFISGNSRPYLYGSASVDDPAKFTASSRTSAQRSVDPIGFAIRTVADRDASEDSILQDFDRTRPLLARDLILGLEDMVLHGDTAGTHQDTALATFNPNAMWGTTSGAGGSGDHRRGMLGLRARAYDIGATAKLDFSATMSFANLMALAAKMSPPHGVAGQNILAVGYDTYLTDLVTLTELKTIDLVGVQNATVLGMRVAKVGTWNVELTPFLASEYPNTGLYTTAGNLAVAVGFNSARYRMYVRRAVTIESVVDIERGTVALVGRWRGLLHDIDNGNSGLSSASVRNVVCGYNI